LAARGLAVSLTLLALITEVVDLAGRRAAAPIKPPAN
jgi:hypothetical protein